VRYLPAGAVYPCPSHRESHRISCSSRRNTFGQVKVEERRASRRYKLALHVEIRIESDLQEFEPISGRTCDISPQGFYFRIVQSLSVGMKIGFSIMPPGEATNAFISGKARVVRVEEISDDSIDHVGVGAVIGKYKFGRAELLG
jgi:c-di-GMP-binding flagellar brake protein YcgR